MARTVLEALLPRIALAATFAFLLASTWLLLLDTNLWLAIFCTIFSFRYTRLLGHLIGHSNYKPSTPSLEPSFGRKDVTVIISTVAPNKPEFQECVRGVLANFVASIIVTTVGADLKEDCRIALENLSFYAHGTSLSVVAVSRPNKRRQIHQAMTYVDTAITIIADDNAFWRSENFIPSVLAPFDNAKVGMVATKQRPRRTTPGEWSWKSISNFLACNYFERQNWEIRASNAIDGGVFVIPGSTAVYRTEFLSDEHLLAQLHNNVFFFGLFMRPSTGADGFLTRSALKSSWRVRYQDTEDATVEVETRAGSGFHDQLVRQARATCRNNHVMLGSPEFLFRYTWSALNVYWASITNFALLWDIALIFSMVKASQAGTAFSSGVVVLLILWIIATKTVKIMSHLYQTPVDFPLLITQVAFGYIHSFYKLWALITFWKSDSSETNIEDVSTAGEKQDRREQRLGTLETIQPRVPS